MASQPERINAPSPPHFAPEMVPKSIKGLPRYSCWGGVTEKAWPDPHSPSHIVEKLDKAPKTPAARQASSTNESTWTSLDSAVQAVRTRDDLYGIGIQLLSAGLIGIDLDNVLTLRGAPRKEYRELVATLEATTYVEKSPSGHGVRAFYKVSTRRPTQLDEETFSWWEGGETPDQRHKRGVEIYNGSSGRFLTITGNRLANSKSDIATLAPATEAAIEAELSKLRARGKIAQAGSHRTALRTTTDTATQSAESLQRALEQAGLKPRRASHKDGSTHIKVTPCIVCQSRSGGTVHLSNSATLSYSCFSTKCETHRSNADYKTARRAAAKEVANRIGWPNDSARLTSIRARGGVPSSRTAKDIDPETVTWLLEGWLLEKGVHVLAGKQGEGKSYFLAMLTASLTRGCEIEGIGKPPPCRVLYCASEDDAASVLRPRMEGARADLRFVEIIDAPFLASDLLDAVIQEIRKKKKRKKRKREGPTERPIVVILDALDSFLGIEDSKDNQEVRRRLEGLRQCAASEHVCIIGVKHKRKDDNNWGDVYSVAGASAYTEVARVAWMLKRDDTRSNSSHSQVIVEVAKNNYGATKAGVEFHITSEGISWKGDTGRRLHELREESTRDGRAKTRKTAFWKRLATGYKGNRTYTTKEMTAIGRAVGVSESTVSNYIREGVDQGWLKPKGKRGCGRYQTTEKTMQAAFTW